MKLLKNVLVLSLAFVATQGYSGTDSKRRFSFEFQTPQLTGGNGQRGWLGGLGYYQYLGMSPISIGPAIYYGTNAGGQLDKDNLTMAGLKLDFDGYFAGKVFVFRGGVFGGYAFADLNQTTAGRTFSGLVVEPSASLGFVLGNGWRLTAGAGYLYNQTDPRFTGPVFNILLERKVLQQTKSAL